ncbi:DUF3017 domain-containing protein [Gordonia sp. (in: high G+C Gram-positive bacteria)]|jgi:hypothetical protein|uniref:DUF3017 domain-containing protein n=1 Tax=Gordonia sp. (in: high G+C Gram-positive bacteria) TaxID=84139 RepID=UPI003FA5F0F3
MTSPTPDASPPDSASPDATLSDSAAPDAVAPDTAVPDTAVSETGALDEEHERVGPLRALLVELPYILVLLAALLAAVFVTFDRWRRGVFVLGSALLLGSLLRALLPSERAGLLQVRGRAFDSALMASAGVAILWLATSIDSLGTDSLQ